MRLILMPVGGINNRTGIGYKDSMHVVTIFNTKSIKYLLKINYHS